MDWICVRCGGRLTMSEEGLACDSCGQCFPIVGEVPVLVADPDLFLQITKFNFIDTRLQLAVLRRESLEENISESRSEPLQNLIGVSGKKSSSYR